MKELLALKAKKAVINQWNQQTKDTLKDILGTKPLADWEKSKPYCVITPKNPDIVITGKNLPCNMEDRLEFEVQIKELLDQGLVRKSQSPHNSPAFFVRKNAEIKRKKPRMVIDYRELNKNVVFDSYQIPNKDNLIALIGNKKVFSKFDCTSGFWQIKMEENSIPWTSFSVPQGKYEWLVMPFGFKNAPQVFRRRMDDFFRKYQEYCLVYIDDVLVASMDEESHKEHVKTILYAFKENGITISEKKMVLGVDCIDFLGLNIHEGKIKLQDHITTRLLEWPDELKTMKELQSFLGLLNQASDFMKDIAKLRAGLTGKLKGKTPFKWTEYDSVVIRKIKDEVKKLPKLGLPNANDHFIMETDASQYQWGVVYYALDYLSGERKLCGYRSGTFKDAETRYSAHELEVLAVLKGIERYDIFLRPKQFTVVSDSSFVARFRDIMIPKSKNARLIRWQILWRQYNFVVEHKKGK